MKRTLCLALVLVGRISPPARAEDARLDVPALQARVTELRGLPFRRDVKIGVKTVEQLRAKIREEMEEEFPGARLKAVETAGVVLGVFPAEFDLRRTLESLLTDQIAGFYDPERKELYLVEKDRGAASRAADDLLEKLSGMSSREVYAVHELTHALQDQHYDLETLPVEIKDNDDLVLAVKSLVEGDATYVMYDHIARAMGEKVETLAMQGLQAPESALEGAVRDAPEFLRAGLVFPYVQGFTFVQKTGGPAGAEALARLYADPPASTEQILHPDKYAAATRDAPVVLRWPRPPQFPPPEWDLLEANVLGEFGIRTLLKVRGAKTPKTAAAGWDGDRFEVYERARKAGEPDRVLVWAATWDSGKDAGQFAAAIGAVFSERAGGGAVLKGPAQGWQGWRDGSRTGWVFCEGADVIVIDGHGGDDAPAGLVAHVRGAMTRTEMTKVERVPRKARSGSAATDGGTAAIEGLRSTLSRSGVRRRYRLSLAPPPGWTLREGDEAYYVEDPRTTAVVRIEVVAQEDVGTAEADTFARNRREDRSRKWPGARPGPGRAGAGAAWTLSFFDAALQESFTVRETVIDRAGHFVVASLGAVADDMAGAEAAYDGILTGMRVEAWEEEK